MSLIHRVQIFIMSVTITRVIAIRDQGSPEPAEDVINYRLDQNVIPYKYEIYLEPNMGGDFRYFGKSVISVKITNATNEIILHAKELTVSWALVTCPNSSIAARKIDIDTKTNFLKIELLSPIRGFCSIWLDYTGTLGRFEQGFFRRSYVNKMGKEVWFAATQFQPTSARRAFPCFDEPGLKATFKISIVHPNNYVAVSNMPAEVQRVIPDYTTETLTQFAETPFMSTYLVAFVISDFKFIQTKDGAFRIFGKGDVEHAGKFALGLGPKLLGQLETYLNQTYVVPVINNFAIPKFYTGAMENWGLVIYKEEKLLSVESVRALFSNPFIAETMAHEFAHNYFGNLVSPSWWDDIWLSEGLAKYFQYFIIDKVKPSWRKIDQFVVEQHQNVAFVRDAEKNQHPLDVKVHSPAEIKEVFDSISYVKGACVIRMISHILTEPVFAKGLQHYLAINKFQSVTPATLFDAFETASTGQIPNLKRMLELWADQAGYPVITVTRNYETGNVSVTQKRFLENSSESSEEKWIVPINYATECEPNFDNTAPMKYLNNNEEQFNISGIKNNSWIIFNKQQTGYYRVNYDATNWKLIANYLKSNTKPEIHVLNRAQLLDDSFSLATAGELPDYTTFLDLTTYLPTEDDFIPWIPAYRAFAKLNSMLVNTQSYNFFKIYVLRLLTKLDATFGLTETDRDDYTTVVRRWNMIGMASSMGSKKHQAAAQNALIDAIRGKKMYSEKLQRIVFCAGIRMANTSIFKELQRWKQPVDLIILHSLGCSFNSTILKEYLTTLLETNYLRVTVMAVYYVLTSNTPVAIEVAFDFIRDNFSRMSRLYGGITAIEDCMNMIAKKITNRSQLDEFEAFINSLPDEHDNLSETLKSEALVMAEASIQRSENLEFDINKFFIDHVRVQIQYNLSTTTKKPPRGRVLPRIRIHLPGARSTLAD